MSFQVGDRVVVAVDLPHPYLNYPRSGTEAVIVQQFKSADPNVWWEVKTEKRNLTKTGGWVFMTQELEPLDAPELWSELELM